MHMHVNITSMYAYIRIDRYMYSSYLLLDGRVLVLKIRAHRARVLEDLLLVVVGRLRVDLWNAKK